jgi:hypothetical protein
MLEDGTVGTGRGFGEGILGTVRTKGKEGGDRNTPSLSPVME